MLVASAISLCSDIHGLRSIGVQRKPSWQRTSDDVHSVCRGRSGRARRLQDGLVAARSAGGQGTLNAEAADRLSVE
jgi:hypothetical protein